MMRPSDYARMHSIWSLMIRRVTDPRHSAYDYYGGRGICVVEEWRDFDTFAAWAEHNGYAATLTLDRIDSDGGYGPDNCRWSTLREQMRNTRRAHLLTVDGVTKPLAQWADERGVPYRLIHTRITRLGWPHKRAVEAPVVSINDRWKG